MFRHTLRIVCLVGVLVIAAAGQRITTTNAQGLTVVATPSVDGDGDTVLRTITTIGRVAGPASASITPSVTTTTSGFTTRQYATTPTVAVSSGTILNYSSYKSRVDAEVSSISVSRVNAYLETATAFGLKTSSGAAGRIPPRLGIAAAVVGIWGWAG